MQATRHVHVVDQAPHPLLQRSLRERNGDTQKRSRRGCRKAERHRVSWLNRTWIWRCHWQLHGVFCIGSHSKRLVYSEAVIPAMIRVPKRSSRLRAYSQTNRRILGFSVNANIIVPGTSGKSEILSSMRCSFQGLLWSLVVSGCLSSGWAD